MDLKHAVVQRFGVWYSGPNSFAGLVDKPVGNRRGNKQQGREGRGGNTLKINERK